MTLEKATFGAGCFWGVEARFAALPGVRHTTVGFAGGTVQDPTYEQVCTGRTGHAEVVEVSYNPEKISYGQLLEAFFSMHNPAQPYRSAAAAPDGPSSGPNREQYRSVVFTHTAEQADAAHERIGQCNASGKYPAGVATQVLPAPRFWRAEERHQQYFAKRNIQLPEPAAG